MTIIGIFFMLISGLVYSLCLKLYLNKRPMWSKVEYIDTKGSHSNIINGNGFSSIGEFRKIGKSYVTYTFLCFWGFPIYPDFCLRIGKKEKDDVKSMVYASDIYKYPVYGTEKWSLLELLQLYIFCWSARPLMIFFIIVGIYFVFFLVKMILNF